MTEEKLQLYIRTSLVAPLIGKSQYNKDYEAFIKLLNMNKYEIYTDKDEFEEILNLKDKYDLEIITRKYNNVYELQQKLNEIQNFVYSDSIIEKCKKYMICTFGKTNEKQVLDYYLQTTNNKKDNNMDKQFLSVKIFESKYFDVILTGTPDCITIDNKIVEVKNRVHTFSKSIKECDLVQLQLYLNMYEIQYGHLVEGMIYSDDNIKLNEFVIEKDPELYSSVKECIIRICILLYFLLKDEKLYSIFESKNNIDKSNFILKNLMQINSVFTGLVSTNPVLSNAILNSTITPNGLLRSSAPVIKEDKWITSKNRHSN